ncbi:MAG: GAF domain-containing protein [Verrucomicrobiaceae bacterium]|nr:MAG: GAF domain-containing protein [Verrucomicrobiaceae bacterium]
MNFWKSLQSLGIWPALRKVTRLSDPPGKLFNFSAFGCSVTFPGSHEPTALELCSREPIHIPGSIQPHGALLVLEQGSLDCLQVSANWTELTGILIPASSITGKPLEEMLGAAAADQARRALSPGGQEAEPDQLLSLSLPAGDFDTVLHRHDSVVIAELEPSAGPPAIPLNRKLQQAMADLRAAASLSSLYDSMARSVGLLTGYGRVMVYRFDRDWHGEVVGEYISSPGMESYRSHHFPASDIPEQARALYTKNWLRIIPEVHYTPAPLLPPGNPVTGRPLDLSFSVLRSVSPIHLEYLKNMGVGASMSVSLITEGRLWGLIACHHPSARRLPFHIRSACEIFGQVASLEVSFREENQRLGESAAATRIQTSFFDVIAEEPNFAEALVNYTPRLLEFMNAGGAALHLNGRTTLLGAAPDEKHLPDLLDWLRTQEMTPVFSTDALSGVFPPAAAYQGCGSGLLAVRLSPVEFQCVLFFRPEVITEITWAGNPRKPVIPGRMLSPRRSFDAWVETVRGQSLPWTEAELSGGAELRTALNALVLKRTERLISSNEELAKRNTDLQSFAYIAAHDLKEPLRNLARYSQFMEEDHGAEMNTECMRKLRTIQELAEHCGRLIEALSRFSSLGRIEINRRLVDAEEMLNGVLASLEGFLNPRNVEIRRPRELPTVFCDPVLVREVFLNLITNAAKYTGHTSPWIEISWRENPEKKETPIFYVADNGIGIAERHWDVIFTMFRRLHAQGAYGGGTGTGLAIARSIVERHGGWISVQSTPGSGSTFSFTPG